MDLPKTVTKFAVSFVLLYLAWYLLYTFLINPWGKLDAFVIDNSITLTKALLSGLGFNVLVDGRSLIVDGVGGVWIGDPCNGLDLFILFAIFIIAYPFGNWKYKSIYAIIGIILIHLVNTLRISVLILIQRFYPSYLDFNHKYTFTLLVYSFIFLLWILVIKRMKTR